MVASSIGGATGRRPAVALTWTCRLAAVGGGREYHEEHEEHEAEWGPSCGSLIGGQRWWFAQRTLLMWPPALA
jgi:hypothetical protein